MPISDSVDFPTPFCSLENNLSYCTENSPCSILFARCACLYSHALLAYISVQLVSLDYFTHLRVIRFSTQKGFRTWPTVTLLISNLRVIQASLALFPGSLLSPESHLLLRTASFPCSANSSAFWTCMALVAWSPCTGTSWLNLLWWWVSDWILCACGHIRELNGRVKSDVTLLLQVKERFFLYFCMRNPSSCEEVLKKSRPTPIPSATPLQCSHLLSY